MRAFNILLLVMFGLIFTSPSAEARFLQTDPIGYEDQMNLYGYVHNDPLNATDPMGLDTVIKMRANVLGKHPVTGKPFAHAFIEYTDTNTGESRISRAGPQGPFGRYPGNNFDAVMDKGFPGTVVGAEDTEAKASTDYNNPTVVDIDSVTVTDDIGDVTKVLNQFNKSVNDAKTTYKPRSQNSNTYAGDAYKEVTGNEATNNSAVDLPGIENDLPTKKPNP